MSLYVSVIIPIFNEEGVIENNINRVAKFLYSYLGREKAFEIIMVNDGSTDSTKTIIDHLARKRDYLIALHHIRNIGRGKALQTGFDRAAGKYIFTLDADLSYSPEHIRRMLPLLEDGTADLVLASAYHPKGKVSNVPFKRAVVSRFGNKLLSISLGGELTTVTCVVRGYTKELLDTLELFSDDKDIHLETIQKAIMLGYRIMEIPAELRWQDTKRTRGEKGLSLKSFSHITRRHLFYNFLFRPGMLFWLPLIVLGIIFLSTGLMIIYSYFHYLNLQPQDIGILRFYYALRENIVGAKVTFFVWSLSLILLFQFVSLAFISKQSAYYYQELFCHLSRLTQRMKKLGGDK